MTMVLERRRVEKPSSVKHNKLSTCEDDELKMVCGSYSWPKEKVVKTQALGEDAHFICAEADTFGVADGVGGWARKGVDAGEFARQLMTNAATAARKQPAGAVDPRKILMEAYASTKNIQGSSTACILTLNKDGFLHAVNLGDSGFLVFRNNRLLYKSPPQQHRFNCPYQLGSSDSSDKPDKAWEVQIGVIPGDVVVLGTDGLLDNMYESEIGEAVAMYTQLGMEPQAMASLIAQLAYECSIDEFSFRPFSCAALEAGLQRVGGKIDDITVVVAQIMSSS